MTGYTRKVGLRKPRPSQRLMRTIADTQGRYVINVLDNPEQVFTELQWRAFCGSL